MTREKRNLLIGVCSGVIIGQTFHDGWLGFALWLVVLVFLGWQIVCMTRAMREYERQNR